VLIMTTGTTEFTLLLLQAMHQTLMSQMDQPVKDDVPSDVKMSNKEELTQIQRMMVSIVNNIVRTYTDTENDG